MISIHALRVEGDLAESALVCHGADFYPRPPGGGRRATALGAARHPNFYPRPPGGGRPIWQMNEQYEQADFYPRPPGGGRLSAHAGFTRFALFLSTPSGWRATVSYAISRV